MPVSQVKHSNAKRIRLEDRMAEDNQESPASEVYRVEERPEHGMKILQGLNKLKNDKILCDVTLIAEGRKNMWKERLESTCIDMWLRSLIFIERYFGPWKIASYNFVPI